MKDHVLPVRHCDRCDTSSSRILSEQWFVKMEPLAAARARGGRERPDRASSPNSGRRPTSTGWRTSATGASRASSGGATGSRPGTARLRAHDGRARRPDRLRRTAARRRSAGPGRPRHLVLLGALAVLDAGLARRDRRPRRATTRRRARHRPRHHLLLGRADDHDGPALHGRGAVPRGLHPRPRARRAGPEDVQVAGNVIDPARGDRQYGADAVRFTLAALAAPGQRHPFGARAHRGRTAPSPTSSGTPPASC